MAQKTLFDKPAYRCNTCGRTMSTMEVFSEFGTFQYKKLFYCSPQCAHMVFLTEEELKEAVINYMKSKYNKVVKEDQVKIDPKRYDHYQCIVYGVKKDKK